MAMTVMEPSYYTGLPAAQGSSFQYRVNAFLPQNNQYSPEDLIGPRSSSQNGHDTVSEGTSETGQISTATHVLTIRLLMQGKEVGSIIGKKGDQIKKIREESGAKINISDGSCPERIVTITGTLNVIAKTFNLICNKFEDDMLALPNSVPKPPITMRLIVPATQCGSLIGKQGSKIKDIREATGASIQVASELLPSSTERAVTISGSSDAIKLCIEQVCQILVEAPPKGTNIAYRPKPTFNPVVIASNAAAVAAQQQQAQQLGALQNSPYASLFQQQQQQLMLLNQELAARASLAGAQGAPLLHPLLSQIGLSHQQAHQQQQQQPDYAMLLAANSQLMMNPQLAYLQQQAPTSMAQYCLPGTQLDASKISELSQYTDASLLANQGVLIGAPFIKTGQSPENPPTNGASQQAQPQTSSVAHHTVVKNRYNPY